MKPAELARKAADAIRSYRPGLVSSWSECMLDAVYQADAFANSDEARAVVDAIGRLAPKHPHRWSYHPERVRAEVVRGFERAAITLEAQR